LGDGDDVMMILSVMMIAKIGGLGLSLSAFQLVQSLNA